MEDFKGLSITRSWQVNGRTSEFSGVAATIHYSTTEERGNPISATCDAISNAGEISLGRSLHDVLARARPGSSPIAGISKIYVLLQ